VPPFHLAIRLQRRAIRQRLEQGADARETGVDGAHVSRCHRATVIRRHVLSFSPTSREGPPDARLRRTLPRPVGRGPSLRYKTLPSAGRQPHWGATTIPRVP
jgi:hypothetical protein